MQNELTFADMIGKSLEDLIRRVIAERVEHIMNDPVMLREYIEQAVEHEVNGARHDKLSALEELYNLGVWA